MNPFDCPDSSVGISICEGESEIEASFDADLTIAFKSRSALSVPTTGAPSRMTTESKGDTYSDANLQRRVYSSVEVVLGVMRKKSKVTFVRDQSNRYLLRSWRSLLYSWESMDRRVRRWV